MENLIKKLDRYRNKYNISIQFWDEINIFVEAKDFYMTEILSIGGYEDLDSALNELFEYLDRWINE